MRHGEYNASLILRGVDASMTRGDAYATANALKLPSMSFDWPTSTEVKKCLTKLANEDAF